MHQTSVEKTADSGDSSTVLGSQTSLTLAQESRPVIVLAVVAIITVLLYLFVFVYPYNIFKLYPYPQLAVYRFAQDEPMVIWWFSLVFVIQSGLYWLGWRAAQKASGSLAWFIVIGGAAASGFVLLFLYPFDAADVFMYALRGRIASVYGANPLRDMGTQFVNDPFYPYAAWQHVASFYGPAWEMLAISLTWLAGNGIIANVLAFKLAGGLFLAASVAIVVLILRQVAPQQVLAGVVLLAWNPVLLYETLGNGHNDITLVFCILAATWALCRSRYTLAILALILGVLFKFIPILLLPAAGLIALRRLAGARARLRFLVVTTFAGLALIALAYAPFWYGPEILDLGPRSRIFTASLPAFFYTWLSPTWGQEQAALLVSRVAMSLTLLFTLWQSWRAWRNPSWLGFSHAAINILLFYLLITCAWFQQWYAIWPLGLAALLSPGPGVYLTLLLGGYTLLSKHIIFGPLIYRLHPFPGGWREIWFGPMVLGVPWLYAFVLLIENFARQIIPPEENPLLTAHEHNPTDA